VTTGDPDVAVLGPLRQQGGPDPAVVALIAAAVDEVWPRAVPPGDDRDPAHRNWRFSGRWWNRPTPIRRERPWAGTGR
jgi:hypothetical protein